MDVDPVQAAMEDAANAAPAAAAPTPEDPVQAAMDDAQAAPAATPPGGAPPPVHRPPTRFHRAAAPAPTPKGAPPAAPPDWGQALTQGVQNLLPSTAEGLGSMVSAVTHPGRTLDALGQLASGIGSQVAGAVGMQQDPKTKAKTEALAQALENHYTSIYGPLLKGDTSGLRRAIATDPFGILMDAATVVPVVGAGAKAAGLARTGEVISKAGSFLDPIQNAARLAKGVVVNPVTRSLSGLASGAPASALKVAAAAGEGADPALRAAFLRFYNGQGDATEYLQTAQSALGQVKQDASDAYLAGKGSLAKVAPSFAPIDQAITDARAATQPGGVSVGQFQPANDALDSAQQMIDGWKATPGLQTIDGFDKLKQAIWDLRGQTGNSVAQQHLGGLYNAVKQSITDVDPKYAGLMEQYQQARNGITDLTKTLGAGPNVAATNTLLKNLRALKTPTGQTLFQQLNAKEPSLAYMLAGHALSPIHAGGLRGALEIPTAIALGTIHPALGIGQALAQSPKLAGQVAYRSGQAVPFAAKVGRPLYYGSEVASEADQGDQGAPPSAADPDAVDAATRMVIGEAGNQPDIGKSAVIHTALNVAQQTGKSLSDVINTPNEFEAVTSGRTAGIDPDSPEYKYVRDNIVLPALQGQSTDPTGGAIHFINKELQRRLGRKIPEWAQGEGHQIGAHTFFANGGRTGYASGGKVDDVEPLVERLMTRMRAAKEGERRATKPLLQLPDNAVAKALDVAQQAI